MKNRIGNFFFLLAASLFPVAASAQFAIVHNPPASLEKSGIAALSFKAPGVQQDQVSEAYLLYWFDTDPNKLRKPATLKDDTFTAEIDLAGSGAGAMMYAFMIEFQDGSKSTFPQQDPENNPVSVGLTDPQVTAKNREGRVGKIDFTVLSPEPGAAVNPADVVVAITLFYKEGDAAPEAFQLKVNGRDVTAESDVTPYLITWTPAEPPAEGNLAIDLSYKNESGRMVSVVNFKSKVSKKVQADQEAKKGGTVVMGTGELAARNQNIAGNTQDIYRGSFNLNGRSGNMRFAANGLATSLENARLQPQNRAGAELYLGKWFEVQAGHIYPQLNNLVLNGRRIYGVNAGLYLFNRNIGFQAVYGEMNRRVENLYTNVLYKENFTIFSNGDTLKDSQTGQPVKSAAYEIGFRDQGMGTHSRKVWGGRFNIGNGRIFGFGLSGLKVEDDTTSILTLRNYGSIPASYFSGLTQSQRDTLAANPGRLEIKASNPQPKGNFVLASDFVLADPKGRFRLTADGAVNILNEDISEGVLNKERAEELGFDLDDDITDALDQLSVLIIVNENIKALPIKFSEDENGEQQSEIFVPWGLFAGQSTLALNVLGNNITAQYMWMGPDFSPLSNSAVRRDIAGFSVSDRIRLFRNRVYITGGYDRFSDNLLNTLEATTTTTTYRAGLGWYPFKSHLPRINVNYRFQNRDNGMRASNPLVAADLQNRAVRSVRRVNQDSLLLLPNARFNDTYQYSGTLTQQIRLLGSQHDISAGYTLVDTRDREFFYGDYKSDIYSAGLTTRWAGLPLKTSFNATWNYTDALSGLNTIDIVGYSGGFELLLFKDKLQLNADVALAQNTITNIDLDVNDNGTEAEVLDDYFAPNPDSKTTSESVSYIVNATARYNFNKNHALAFLLSYTQVESQQTTVRIPNDQIVQVRYILSF